VTPVLALEGITKRFGATLALDAASFTLAAGQVHALLGENGAGKSTLMRVAFGLLAPDAGAIRRDGVVVRWRDAAHAIAHGLGMVHQHYSLVPAMTVAENVALGDRGRFDPAAAAARVRTVAEATGLAVDPGARVADLPVGAQQRVEILKAFAHDARVLILDEPTAVLTPAEADDLLARLRAFADGGGAVVLITHKLREALQVADAVTVLRRGRTVLETPRAAVDDAALVTAMVGERPPVEVRGAARAPGAVVLALRGVAWRDARGVVRLHPTDLAVHAGELVGVAGVEGSGHAELLRLLAGRLPPSAGTVDRPAAVGFIPADRHRDAIALDLTLTENLALAGAGARRGRMPWRALGAAAQGLLAEHDVRAAGPTARLSALSGGNQQKFVVARELAHAPHALVAEDPCRGLDVRASGAVLARLRAARDAGAAVVVSSTDLDEVLALADRVVVCHAGVARAVPATREAAARAMLGAA
jgi:simple sugar transport system ATP-binding protein